MELFPKLQTQLPFYWDSDKLWAIQCERLLKHSSSARAPTGSTQAQQFKQLVGLKEVKLNSVRVNSNTPGKRRCDCTNATKGNWWTECFEQTTVSIFISVWWARVGLLLDVYFRLVGQSRIDFIVLKLTEQVDCWAMLTVVVVPPNFKSSCHYVPVQVVLGYTVHEVGVGPSNCELRQSGYFGEVDWVRVARSPCPLRG